MLASVANPARSAALTSCLQSCLSKEQCIPSQSIRVHCKASDLSLRSSSKSGRLTVRCNVSSDSKVAAGNGQSVGETTIGSSPKLEDEDVSPAASSNVLSTASQQAAEVDAKISTLLEETETLTTAAASAAAGAAAAETAGAAAVAAAGGDAAEAEDKTPKWRRRRRGKLQKLRREEKGMAPWGWEGERGGVEEEKDVVALAKWLQKGGLPRQKMILQGVKEGGRGLVATESIGKGEEVLSIPEGLLITRSTVYSCPRIGEIMSRFAVPDWPALATFLISEGSKGAASNWWPYIATLPRTPGCILQWSVEEIDELLKGSSISSKALEFIADVTDTFRDMESRIFSQHREQFPADVFTLPLFKWAFAVLFSRLVRLDGLPEGVALVPWGDMLNHRCEVEAYLAYDSSKRAVVLKTDRSYNPGQQVYASYGPRSNGELLLAYGIVPTSRNPQDSYSLSMALSPEDEKRSLKWAALAREGLSSPFSFPLRMDGVPSQMLAFARLAAAGPAISPDRIDQLAAAAAGRAEEKNPLWGQLSALSGGQRIEKLEEEIGAREAIVAACQVAIAGYSTTLEEDEAEIADVEEEYLEDDGEQRARLKAAAVLRASEKRILFRTDFVLRAELRDLRATEAAQGGKKKLPLGNNFGGEKGGLVEKILGRIARP